MLMTTKCHQQRLWVPSGRAARRGITSDVRNNGMCATAAFVASLTAVTGLLLPGLLTILICCDAATLFPDESKGTVITNTNPDKLLSHQNVSSSAGQYERPRVVGFWHIGPSAKIDGGKDSVVRVQLEELKAFALIGEVEIRFLHDPETMSNATYALLTAQPKVVPMEIAPEHSLFKKFGPLYEFPSLHNLWKHCHANPTDIVFYMHTKTEPGIRARMQHSVFSNPRRVVDILSEGVDKTWVYAAIACRENPWCHATGNFWWSRCDHIIRLNDPFNAAAIVEAATSGESDMMFYWPPHGRYFAEYWLLSDWVGPRPPKMMDHLPSEEHFGGSSKCGRPGYPEYGDICKDHVKSGGPHSHRRDPKIRDWDGAEV